MIKNEQSSHLCNKNYKTEDIDEKFAILSSLMNTSCDTTSTTTTTTTTNPLLTLNNKYNNRNLLLTSQVFAMNESKSSANTSFIGNSGMSSHLTSLTNCLNSNSNSNNNNLISYNFKNYDNNRFTHVNINDSLVNDQNVMETDADTDTDNTDTDTENVDAGCEDFIVSTSSNLELLKAHSLFNQNPMNFYPPQPSLNCKLILNYKSIL
jgi:hypothetical protein